MTVITIPRVLREKLSEDGAEALVEMINKADEKSKGDVILFVGEKIERRFVESEAKFEKRFTEMDNKIEKRFAETDKKLAETKADIIKWMFIFIFGQFWATTGVVCGLVFFFLKK